MKRPTNGHGTLRMHDGAIELAMMRTAAYAVREEGTHMVRIVMIGQQPGGAQLEVKLSAEDAANFASAIYSLARTAIIKNDRECARDSEAPAFQAVAA